MNKKIFSLLILLILLVSTTISYAFYNQTTKDTSRLPNSSNTLDNTTLTNEFNSTFLDENQGIEIGDMI